jgi:hypothetical protein
VPLVAAVGCGGGDLVLPTESDPAVIEVLDGNGQSGPAGAELGLQIRVKVTDAENRTVAGVAVAFEPVEGGVGGTAAPATVETDGAGIAATVWTLSGNLGAQALDAKVVGTSLAVRFTATAIAGGANRLVLVSGNEQSAAVGTDLRDSLVVRAEDNFGNPVAGVTVEWSAATGTISPASVVTGDDGRAAARRILGSVAGAQTATATAVGLAGSPIEFTHTAVPGTAASLVLISGNGQTGSPGEQLSQPLVVRIVDESGNGIPSQAVTWIVATGGGAVDPSTSFADGEGFASTQWTLGPNPGTNTLSAVASGVGIVNFTATAGQGGGGGGNGEPSASRSRVSADPTSIEAGSGTAQITVTVLDNSGAPVAGATVVLAATGSGNTLTQPSGATGPDGVATGSLSSTVPGTKVVSAQVNGSVSVNQTAQVNVTVAPATTVAPFEGDGQTAQAGTAVPVRPAVRVTNAIGQPVAGFGVTFVVTGGGGSVSGATQTTNSDGIARVGGWTLGPDAGTNTLEARAGSLAGSPVVFTAQATASLHFEFTVQPPQELEEDETFSVEVTIKDATGATIPLNGANLEMELFREGQSRPSNRLAGGSRQATVNGVAVFPDLRVTNNDDNYRLRVRSNDVAGAEPVFSIPFDVD